MIIPPGGASLGSSGTVRWPQAKSLLLPHGANATRSDAARALAGRATEAHTARSTAAHKAPLAVGRTDSNLSPQAPRCEPWAPPLASTDELFPRDRLGLGGAARDRALQPRSARRGPALLLRPNPARPCHRASSSVRRRAEQARRCLQNLQAVCDAAGTSLGQALRLTVYMTDLDEFGEVNEVYESLLPRRASRPRRGRGAAVAARRPGGDRRDRPRG